MSIADNAVPVERRQNPRLRALFEEAYLRIEPCLDPKQTWGGLPLEILAFRTLREAYPDLPSQEARLLVRAAVRVFRQRNPARADHLPAPEAIDLAGQGV
jgi:hypothetical protein